MNAADKLLRARSALVTNHPFFGCLALSLHVVEDDKEAAGTMATDGKSLFYSPSFVDGLSDSELRGVLAHEVWHCACCHMTRRQSRDHALWNDACDYVINLDVLASGFVLPPDGLIDHRFKGFSAEEVYAALESQKHKPKPRPGGVKDAAPAHEPAKAAQIEA